MKYLAFTTLFIFKVALLPDTTLLFWMAIAIALDFITGFSKAAMKGDNRTSSGTRKTLAKFLQYGGCIAIGVILSQAAEQKDIGFAKSIIPYCNDALVLFIIYVEVMSICENLIAISPDSTIAKFIITPLHKILTVQIRKAEKAGVAAVEDPTQDSFIK